MSELYSRVNPLTQEQRERAYRSARSKIAGERPTQSDAPAISDFESEGYGRFSVSTMRIMRAVGLVVLCAAFIPSAIRIYIASVETANAIADLRGSLLVIVMGLTGVLIAESGQVAFTIWASATGDRKQRLALHFASWVCTAIALVGNAQVIQPWTGGHYLFAWLETFAPPVLVLIASHVQKTQLLQEAERRTAIKRAFDAALFEWQKTHRDAMAEWSQQMENAEASPHWATTLAIALRDAIYRANDKRAIFRDLTASEWRLLVLRERQSEEWWAIAEHQAEVEEAERSREQERIARLESRTSTQNATGELADSPVEQRGDFFVRRCPECSREFEGGTARQATNKLTAHMKAHRNETRREVTAVAFSANGTQPHAD